MGLYVGSNLVGVAVDDTGAGKAFDATAGDGAAVTYKFAAVDSNAPVADTDLGTLTLKDDSSNAIAANTFDTAVNVGKKLGQTVDTSSLKTVDASGLDKDKILAAAKAAGIESGEITLSKNAENKLELKVGEKIIGVATAALDNSATSFTINGADGTALGTVETSAAVAVNGFTGTVKTGLTYAAESYTTPSSMTNNTSETTGVNAAEAVKAVYSFAVTETTALVVGDTITIGSGDSAKTFTVISDGFGDPAEGQVKVSDVTTGISVLKQGIMNKYKKTNE